MGNLDVIIHDKSGSEISRWSQSGHVDSEWKRGFVSFPANAEMVCFHVDFLNIFYTKQSI